MEDNKLPLKFFEVGDRVLITCSLEGNQLKSVPATIVAIEKEFIFLHEWFPIQVVLDEPYDENNHTTIRVNLTEIKYE